jgi:hypothetical protein
VAALMKLAGGSPSFASELNVDAFLEQARSYDEATNSLIGWYLRNAQTRALSHPLPVMRAKEIDRWAQSPEYKSLLSKNRAYRVQLVEHVGASGAGGSQQQQQLLLQQGGGSFGTDFGGPRDLSSSLSSSDGSATDGGGGGGGGAGGSGGGGGAPSSRAPRSGQSIGNISSTIWGNRKPTQRGATSSPPPPPPQPRPAAAAAPPSSSSSSSSSSAGSPLSHILSILTMRW